MSPWQSLLGMQSSQIAKTLGLTLIRHRSDAFASDRWLIDVDLRVFAIWAGTLSCRQVSATHLISSTGARSSNELHWLDFKIGHQDRSPNNGRHGDMHFWINTIPAKVFHEWETIQKIKKPGVYCKYWVAIPVHIFFQKQIAHSIQTYNEHRF